MSKNFKNINQAMQLISALGWQDIKQKYRRSVIGPLWITLSMGILIISVGVVFGGIFKAPLYEFLPFLTAGLVIWTFISTVITEGTNCFIAAEGIIKELPVPLFVHIGRIIWRNFIIMSHNIIILPLVMLYYDQDFKIISLFALFGFIILVLNLFWIVFLIALICTRYRDFTQIIISGLQVAFYITPVMWMPNLLQSSRYKILLEYNPFSNYIELIRGPLLGFMPNELNWAYSIASLVFGIIITIITYNKYRYKLVYWI